MMVTVHKLDEFILECESRSGVANKIEEEGMVPDFLSVRKQDVLCYCDFLAPFRHKDKKFSKLVDALARYFELRPISKN